MASVSTSKQFPARMSFAQVAAAAANTARPALGKTSERSGNENAPKPAQTPAGKPVSAGSNDIPHVMPPIAVLEVPQNEINVESGAVQSDLIDLVKTSSLDDRTAALSISDSVRKDNSDTKSVASRATFIMEEKESLRPDDSASMQAGLDEDGISVQGSNVATSRGPSDPDARAFDDQLREINRTGLAHRLPPRNPVLYQPQSQNGAIIYTASQEASFSKPIQETEPKSHGNVSDMGRIPPDEKLLEALRSPRDRVFVLKIEQDIIDFVKDTNEHQLHLPQTHAFYRMLTHKLADYYLLQHTVDESMTSVRLFRTPNCRLPPPLIDLNSPAANTNTPPPNAPMRKIMRRGGQGHNSRGQTSAGGTAESSANPSKTTSEIGTGSSSDDGRAKDKSALTREERENRYNEARARIFKDYKPQDGMPDGAHEPNEMSRSSSMSGSKRANRNNRNNDDGFEARSAYTQYLPGSVGGGYQGHFAGPAQHDPYANPAALSHPPSMQLPYGQGPAAFGMHIQNGATMNSFGWGFHAMNGTKQNYANQNSSTTGTFNAGHRYQDSVQTLPIASNANQTTPKMVSPLPAYQNGFQPFRTPDQASWPSSPGYNSQFPSPGYGYPDGQHNAAQQAQPYNYQGMPMNTYPQAQHDFTYQQQLSMGLQRQFNPLSQSFIPGSIGSSPQGYAAVYHPFTGHPGRYNASPGVQPVGTYMPSFPHTSGGHLSQPHTPVRSSHQTPRSSKSNQSSIAKWGTPSTLPPKPPPPATSLQPPPSSKDGQLPLPPHPLQPANKQSTTEASPTTTAA